jgi:Protein of unknown function (DUF3558)
MKPLPTIAAAALVTAMLTACTSNNKPTADRTTAPPLKATHTTASTSTGTPASSSGTPTSSPKGQATSLDPCQLVTQSDASALANATFGPGKLEGTAVSRRCVYGAQTPNVLDVFVLQGASTDDAQASWNQLLTEAKKAAGQASNLITLTPQSGLADRAEWVELNLATIHVAGRGLAFLSGSVGVYMVDLVRDGAAPSRQAMTAEAQTVLSRLP